ncbi:hypothetical protein CYMTET_3089 [Cymbomonas tetramitiformis]|uniref:Uncharacterized protein n=1 Tax=Cymbomonas tetramitiformis TaxID=36881 RepID=A0AAE0H405_9CHLO|nr:hypothetical protein CYMTET_3089 [Cymbomonas tetramitiformis]
MENNALTSLIDRALVTDIHGANRALDNLMCDVLLPSTDCKAVHVHACCKKMHAILHGLDAGLVCVLDATARRLHINDIIVLHYDHFDEVCEAYYKEIVQAPEKYFAMHDDGPTLHATFDDHVQTKKPRGRYVRCHHNKAIQRLITNGAFLHNLVILFLYSKVAEVDRFGTGYKTLMMVAQRGTADLTLTSQCVDKTSSATTALDETYARDVRSPNLMSKLHSMLKSLFYFWFGVHESTGPARDRKQWSGCVNDRTVWACAWSEFTWLRDAYPTYCGQRSRALHAFLWRYSDDEDGDDDRLATLIATNQAIVHSLGVCDANMQLYVNEDRAVSCNLVTPPRERVTGLCATLMVQLYSALAHQANVTPYLDMLTERHGCVVDGLYAWGEGAARLLPDGITNGAAPDCILHPYIKSAKWFFADVAERYCDKRTHVLARYTLSPDAEHLQRMRPVIGAFIVWNLCLRNAPERYDVPVALWTSLAHGADPEIEHVRAFMQTRCAHLLYAVDVYTRALSRERECSTLSPEFLDRVSQEVIQVHHITYCNAPTARALYIARHARVNSTEHFEAQLGEQWNGYLSRDMQRIRDTLRAETHACHVLKHTDHYRYLDVVHTARVVWSRWMRDATVLVAALDEGRTAVAVDHEYSALFGLINAYFTVRNRAVVSLEAIVASLERVRLQDTRTAVTMLVDLADDVWRLRDPVYAQFGVRVAEESTALRDVGRILGWVVEDQKLHLASVDESQRTALALLVGALKHKRKRQPDTLVTDARVGFFLLLCALACGCVPRGWRCETFAQKARALVANFSSKWSREQRVAQCSAFLQSLPTMDSQKWMLRRADFIKPIKINVSTARSKHPVVLFDIIKTFMSVQQTKSSESTSTATTLISTDDVASRALDEQETCDEACNEERQHLYLMQHPARVFCCARENAWHPLFTPMLDLFEVVERRAASADYADVYSNLVVQRRT